MSASTIVPIVEGQGEVAAVRTLIHRIAEAVAPGTYVDVPRPIRVRRNLVVKPEELERRVRLAADKGGGDGRILVLLDADTDCPAELGPALLARAESAQSDRKMAVVLAKAEYEAWFVAAAESLVSPRGLRPGVTAPTDPESVASPKKWIGDRMAAARRYSPTTHQPAFTARFDLESARSAPSFDKMWRSLESLLK